ncbi:hypothetical protein J6590_094451 [Homalodisca vitripennis]|nr:hypothetical protein J6590_094451 [Homalodisca vitripennis]
MRNLPPGNLAADSSTVRLAVVTVSLEFPWCCNKSGFLLGNFITPISKNKYLPQCQTSSPVTLVTLARTYTHQCQINYPPTQSDKGGKLNQSSHTLEERRVAHNTYRSSHLLHSVPSYASPLSDMCVTSVVLAICRKCLLAFSRCFT